MPRCVRPSIVSCSGARGVHLGWVVWFDFCDADRSTQSPVVPIERATDRNRRPCHRSTASDFSAAFPGQGAAPRPVQGSVQSTRLRAGTPRPGRFPKEALGRLPPPSTSDPCPVWSHRGRPPFFRRGKTTVGKRLRPVQLASFIELAQQRSPRLQPDGLRFPTAEPTPAGTRRGVSCREVFPPGTTT